MAWLAAVICVAGFGITAEAGAGGYREALKLSSAAAFDTSAAGLSGSVADSIRSWGTRSFADIRTPVSRMPVYAPRSDVDYKIRVMTPDPNIDYRIRAIGQEAPRLRDPGTPFLPYPNTPFKSFQWKIPDFRLFPRK